MWIAAPSEAHAADLTIMSCQTIIDSLHKDWRATQNLFARYGPSAELNPVVRAVGPDLYFAIWTIGMAALCKESRQWQFISLVVWLVETWAVNTHHATGTVHGIPLLMIQIDLGSGALQSREGGTDSNRPGTQTPSKQPWGKNLAGYSTGK